MLNVEHGAGIADAFLAESRKEGVEGLEESRPVLPSLCSPGVVGKCHQAREQQVLHVVGCLAKLCPQRCLQASQQRLHLWRPIVGHGFVAVDVVQGVVAKVGVGFKPLRSLIADEVELAGRREDEGAAVFARFLHGSLSVALPSEDGDVFAGMPEGHLVPPHGLPPLALQMANNAIHEIALQVFFVGDALSLHQLLAATACPPVRLLGLVASDVDVFRREDADDLVEDVLQETIDPLVAGAIDDAGILAADAGQHADEAIANHGARHLGIGGDGSHAVGGHLYLRHHVHMSLLGISNDVAQLLLRVVAANGCGLSFARVLAVGEVGVTLHAPGTRFSELGIFLDFHPPAVVVGQVQMQVVDFQLRGDVDDFQDFVFGDEAPHHVEHESPIGKPRLVAEGEAAQRLAV